MATAQQDVLRLQKKLFVIDCINKQQGKIMLQSPGNRDDDLADGKTWTFLNDIRLVGELTRVIRTVASGAILEGWAAIAAYRSSMKKGAVVGMCVVGPVFRTATRGQILDLQPNFCRLEVVRKPQSLSVGSTDRSTPHVVEMIRQSLIRLRPESTVIL